MITCKIMYTYGDAVGGNVLEFTKQYVKNGGNIDKIEYDTIELSGKDEGECWLFVGEGDKVEEFEEKCRNAIVAKRLYGEEELISQEIDHILKQTAYQISYGESLAGARMIEEFYVS